MPLGLCTLWHYLRAVSEGDGWTLCRLSSGYQYMGVAQLCAIATPVNEAMQDIPQCPGCQCHPCIEVEQWLGLPDLGTSAL